jgi:dienelactone hydrolase
LYKGSPSATKVLQDAEAVLKFIVHNRKISYSDVVIFGRSIGSGPATWIASKYKVGCLVLLSAFASI